MAALEALEAQDASALEGVQPSQAARLPEVAWAPDEHQPDYAHLLAAKSHGIVPQKRFTFDRRVFDLLVAANHFEPEGHEGRIVFGLRGAVLDAGDQAEGATSVVLRDVRPDHTGYCCTIGMVDPDGTISAYLGSTVPNRIFMRNYYKIIHNISPRKSTRCNLLPTGAYIFRTGAHGKGRIRPALRMTDPDNLRQDAVCTVLRTSHDLAYTHDDLWDRSTPYDNIHCAYFDDKFSSAGCQTIKGANGKGPWGAFQDKLRPLPSDTRFDYVLLTGCEAAIAAQLLAEGREVDRALVAACLGRLRVGSRGEAVTRLQKKLGFNGTGYFGPSTKKRLTEREAAAGLASDGIYCPADDTAFDYGVFGAPASRDRRPTPPQGLARHSVVLLGEDGAVAGAELEVVDVGTWTVADGRIAFAPDPSFVGMASVRYRVADAYGATSDATVRVTVEARNEPPRVLPDAARTQAGVPIALDVLSNDLDLDGVLDIATVRLPDAQDGRVLEGPVGTFRAEPDGTILFTPAPGVSHGEAAARYSVADDRGATEEAEIVVTVFTPNIAPVASDDLANTVQGGTVVIDVLANDADPDAQTQPTGPDDRPSAPSVVTPEAFDRFVPNALEGYREVLVAEVGPLFAEHGLDQSGRLCHFMAQIGHESADFRATHESLNYTSAARIRKMWPQRFATVAHAQPFVRNEEALANKVYGGRMGNTDSGDGYRYRGRGLIQLTGREAYRRWGSGWALILKAIRSAQPIRRRPMASR